ELHHPLLLIDLHDLHHGLDRAMVPPEPDVPSEHGEHEQPGRRGLALRLPGAHLGPLIAPLNFLICLLNAPPLRVLHLGQHLPIACDRQRAHLVAHDSSWHLYVRYCRRVLPLGNGHLMCQAASSRAGSGLGMTWTAATGYSTLSHCWASQLLQ